MKKLQFGESGARRFFSGKGFYIALAVSLIAVGGAAWLGVNSAIDRLESDGRQPQIDNNSVVDEWALPFDTETNRPQSDVPAPSRPSTETAVTEEPAAVQGYILPIKGEVLNPYSGDKVIKSKTLDDWVMHTGMDIAAAEDTPVKAMSGGTVAEVTVDDMWGTTVTIEHADGIVSWYAGLKPTASVKPGQTVKLGDVIGVVGNTADIERAEESHLHFGVKQNGEWIDPADLCR